MRLSGGQLKVFRFESGQLEQPHSKADDVRSYFKNKVERHGGEARFIRILRTRLHCTDAAC